MYTNKEDESGDKKSTGDMSNVIISEVKNLPEKLFVAIECLLNDTNMKVKLAAAITLYPAKRNSNLMSSKEKVFRLIKFRFFLLASILLLI